MLINEKMISFYETMEVMAQKFGKSIPRARPGKIKCFLCLRFETPEKAFKFRFYKLTRNAS